MPPDPDAAPPATATTETLATAAELAHGFLAGLTGRPVGSALDTQDSDATAVRAAFDVPLPAGPLDPTTVLAELAAAAEPGLVASAGPRYFGFVTGGTLPAALGADWLASAWDQNAASAATSPAAAAAEEAVLRWLADLLGLPAGVAGGLVTGGQAANTTGLAVARKVVLAKAGWDLDRQGLAGAPPVPVVVGAERHTTVDRAVRFLGLGTDAIIPVPADDQGRIRPDALADTLAALPTPARATAIVCAQAGNVNTGACDDLATVADIVRAAGAGWLHVDGAFGLWAAASPTHRHQVAGVEHADSWATDGHKWLNVPYDCGVVFTRHPAAHRDTLGVAAAYLPTGGELRNGYDWVPESSRRTRAFAVWAALRSLGRTGVADLIDRSCHLARRFADRLTAAGTLEIGNDVTLNQVLVRVPGDTADADTRTRALQKAVQQDGTCWLGGTTWRDRAWLRISVSNWSTTPADIDRSADAILDAVPTR